MKQTHIAFCNRKGFLGDAVVKNPPANAGEAGDTGSIPGPGRSFEEGNVAQL